MSAGRIGQAEDLDQYWSKSLLGQRETRVNIASAKRENIWSIEDIEDYPYDGQIRIYGEFEYALPTRSGGTRNKTGQYEYRTGSGLFLLDIKTDRPKPGDVFNDINEQLIKDAKINQTVTISRRRLWSFLRKAEYVKSLEVRDSHGVYDVNSLLKVLQNPNPKQALHEDSERFGVEEPDVVLEVIDTIEYSGYPETIDDLDLDLNNLTIIHAEAGFQNEDSEFAEFTYQRTSIDINAETNNACEYVLQLFERDVIFPASQ